MGVEISRFLTESDLQPHIKDFLAESSWEMMISEGVVFGPNRLREILRKARRLLETAPGPNLATRYELAQGWFSYWNQLISDKAEEMPDGQSPFVKSAKLMPVDNVVAYLAGSSYRHHESGVLFVAGAEGHEGHLHAAKWMTDHLGSWPCPIWVFEQNSYFAVKERGLPFLPLLVRLSMWHYYPGLRIITVAPERRAGVPEATHYQEIFDHLGATYCFAEELDPHRKEKVGRGEPAPFLVIPHLPVEATTTRVERLLDWDGDKDEETIADRIRELLKWSAPPRDSRFLEI